MDVMVTWCEMDKGGWRDVVAQAHKAKKKVVLVQHGRRAVSRIYPPFNEQLVSDEVCVWGENDRKRLETVGVDPDKIIVTGCPLFKHLKSRVPHQGINVVFSPDHWDEDVAENMIVASELDKLKGVNIITKTVKGCQNPAFYRNPVESDRHAPDHMGIVADVLSKADIVVSLSDATFELLAEYLDIPVVCVDLWIPKSAGGDEKYREFKKIFSNGCATAEVSTVNMIVKSHLNHPELLSSWRKQMAKDDGASDLIDPIYRLINVIENI
jgi:hypothetical protein